MFINRYKNSRYARRGKVFALKPQDPILKKIRRKSAVRLHFKLIQAFFDYERLERLKTIKRRKLKKKYAKY